MRSGRKLAATVLLAGALAACGASRAARERSLEPSLVVSGSLAEDAPVMQVHGASIRYAQHAIELRAQAPVRVSVTSPSDEFDPILECRPVDGRPDETLRSNDSEELGDGAQLDIVPVRDGTWLVYVGDAFGRPGPFELCVDPIHERAVLVAHGETEPALTGTEPPVSLFCQVVEGRRYRVRLEPSGFPAHLALAAPGVPGLETNERALEFRARRTGQAVMQVSSLSLASGAFELRVVELW